MSEGFARRYRLIERIAIGGTAEVFRAELVTDDGGRSVVIKRVLPQFARDERFRRLFLEEACVTATLTHPNIVRVLDHGEIDQTCFITLEPVDGRDLGTLLGRTRATQTEPLGRIGPIIDPSLAALVTIQVAEALQFIHDHTSSEGLPLRIIHRDVSPQNILVSFQGDVKLTDFGIAKSAIRQEHTVDGTLRGKLDYMAPEQATGAEVDHRADLFGLGCVLYEMSAGLPPFRADTEVETLDRLRQGTIVCSPSDLPVPAALKKVLERALTSDPAARYQRAEQMAVDLRAYLSELSVQPSEEALGDWARQMQKHASVDSSADAVDDAVRLLLGDQNGGLAESSTGETSLSANDLAVAAPGTTVFASPAPARGMTGSVATSRVETRPSPPPRSYSRWLAVPLVVVGMLGWVLWMLDRPTGQTQIRGGASSTDRAVLSTADVGVQQDSGVKTIEIRSRPPGASVTVDGKQAGSTPCKVGMLIGGGSVIIAVTAAGFTPWRERIDPTTAPPVLEAVLARRVKPSSGYLTINSLPWSRVFLDGKFVGNTPLVRMQVRAGSRKVQLRDASGRVRRSFVAVVRRNETRSFSFDLTKNR